MIKWNKDGKGGIMIVKAKESRQVQKARLKLRNQLLEEHKLFTENALRKVSEDIKNWISRHAKDRIKLKEKEISLFDENKHSAKTHSRYVQNLLEELSHSSSTLHAENTLLGRVTIKREPISEIDKEFEE